MLDVFLKRSINHVTSEAFIFKLKKNVNDAVIVIVVVIVIVIFIVAFIVIVMCDQEPFLTQCLFLPFQVSPHFSKSAHLRLLH